MKRGIVLTAVMLMFTAWSAPRASGAILYTTFEDWTEWNGAGQINKTGYAGADLDSNLTNGLGNNTAAGSAGTTGSMQAQWTSGTFDYFFGDGDQNNAALRTALGTSPSGGYAAA